MSEQQGSILMYLGEQSVVAIRLSGLVTVGEVLHHVLHHDHARLVENRRCQDSEQWEDQSRSRKSSRSSTLSAW